MNKKIEYFRTLSNLQRKSYLQAHRFFSQPQYESSFGSAIKSVSSLQGWLEYYVQTNRFNEKVSEFFVEAVNDAILAYYFARVGTWRPALQNLRSTLENTLVFLYYMDHPVEFLLWEKQKHRMTFSELSQYFKKHPSLSSYNHQTQTGLNTLDSCYSDLSKAVHGSVGLFRMVNKSPRQGLPSIHVQDNVELSRFTSSLKKLVEALNQLLVAMFRESLQGAALPSLRAGIAEAISERKRAEMKRCFNVMLHVDS